ncbi:hypothetical protein ACFSUK_16650 [Sphingobium scionense]
MLPSLARADDFRDDFPEVMTMSPLGVNLQTGRFRYLSTDFSIGPFVVQSTASVAGSNLRGLMYWINKNTGGGGQMTMIKFTMGKPIWALLSAMYLEISVIYLGIRARKGGSS